MRRTFGSLLAGCVICAAAPVAASAADLAAPVYAAPVVVPAQSVASGWYLRGDVGYSAGRGGGWHETEIESPAAGTVEAGWLSKSHEGSGLIGFGLGYQFNDWLRADVTGEYRGSASLRGSQYSIDSGDVYYSATDFGSVYSWVFLANLYADLGNYRGITPYVGVGIGTAINTFDGGQQISSGGAAGGFGVYDDKTKWNLAGALHAGLSYQVNSRLTLDAGYRFLWMGDVSSGNKTCYDSGGPTGCTPEKWWIKDMYSHDFRIGMRWNLWDDVPAQIPFVAKN